MMAGVPPWMTGGTVTGSDFASVAVLNSAPIAGLMTPVTTVVTMLLNAAPMTTATARSMTLPRRTNSLKPLSTHTPSCEDARARASYPAALVGDVAGVEGVDGVDFESDDVESDDFDSDFFD